jgi:hypothetical protein
MEEYDNLYLFWIGFLHRVFMSEIPKINVLSRTMKTPSDVIFIPIKPWHFIFSKDSI